MNFWFLQNYLWVSGQKVLPEVLSEKGKKLDIGRDLFQQFRSFKVGAPKRVPTSIAARFCFAPRGSRKQQCSPYHFISHTLECSRVVAFWLAKIGLCFIAPNKLARFIFLVTYSMLAIFSLYFRLIPNKSILKRGDWTVKKKVLCVAHFERFFFAAWLFWALQFAETLWFSFKICTRNNLATYKGYTMIKNPLKKSHFQ